jgi:hypothetical protein
MQADFDWGDLGPDEAETWGRLRVAAVSAGDCARVLRRAGFDLELAGPDALLVRCSGVRIARVPLVNQLGPVQLRTILQMTGMTPSMFARYL